MNYVVVGASAAGINGVKTLRQLDPNGKITLISKDEQLYSRCILHHYIAGSRDLKALEFVEDGFIKKYQVDWLKGVSLENINSSRQELLLSNRSLVPYDKVLLASGAATFFPTVKNLQQAKNVVGLRNLADAALIKEKAQGAEAIVVMGAGLVGIDALTGLLHYGKSLTLVEFKSHLLSMQLDKKAAFAYQLALAEQGVKQYYETVIQEVLLDEQGAVKALSLVDGSTIPCDLLIVAVGVRPNIDFLRGSEIKQDQWGLLFNEYGETNVPHVYGAGDISGRNLIWPAAVKEGIIAAANMTGTKRKLTDFFASKATMNFLGIGTLAVGVPEPKDETYQVEVLSDDRGNYKKIIHKDGIITGAIIQGDLAYAGILTQLIKEEINISQVQKSIFAIDYSDFFYLTDQLEFEYH